MLHGLPIGENTVLVRVLDDKQILYLEVRPPAAQQTETLII